MNKKINIPQKGAAKKWAEFLKKLGQTPPPKELMDQLNNPKPKKKIAASPKRPKDVDV